MTAKKRWINVKRFDKNDHLSQQNISWSSSDDEGTPSKPYKRPKIVASERKSDIFRRDDQSDQRDMLFGETYDSPFVDNMSLLSQSSTSVNIGFRKNLSPVLNKRGGLKDGNCSIVRQQEPPVIDVPLFDLSPLLTKDKTVEKCSKGVISNEKSSTSEGNNYYKAQLHKSPVVNVSSLDCSPVLIRDKAFEKNSNNTLPIRRKKTASKQSSFSKVQLHNCSVVNVLLNDHSLPLITDETLEDSSLVLKQDNCTGEQLYYSPLTESPPLISTKTKPKCKSNASSDKFESQQSKHISAEDSVCAHVFDENSPTKPTSVCDLNPSSQLIDSFSSGTSKVVINSATSSSSTLSTASIISYTLPIRKKKYKKNGLMKVLQKVLISQKSSLSIWRHEINLEGVEAVESKEGVIRFRVHLIKREYGNTLLECSSNQCGQNTSDIILVAVSAIVNMDFVVEGEYLLFPPYECRNVLYKSTETVCYFNSSRILRK